MKRLSVFLFTVFLFGCPPVSDPEISRTSLQLSALKKAYLLSLDETFAPVGYEISGRLQDWFNDSLKKEIKTDFTDPETKEKISIRASVVYGLENNAGGLVSLSGQTFSVGSNPDGVSRSFSVSVTLKMGDDKVSFSHLFTVAPDAVLVALQPPVIKIYRLTETDYTVIGEEDWNVPLTPALWSGDWIVVKGFADGIFYYSFNNEAYQQLADTDALDSGTYKIQIPGEKTGEVTFSAYVAPKSEDEDKLKNSPAVTRTLAVNTENLFLESTMSVTVDVWDFNELSKLYAEKPDGSATESFLQADVKKILKPLVTLNPNFGADYYDKNCSVRINEPKAEDTGLTVAVFDTAGNETPESNLTLRYSISNGGRFRMTSFFDKKSLNAVYDSSSDDTTVQYYFTELKKISQTFTVIGAVKIADSGFAANTAYPFFAFSQKDQNRLISMLMWPASGSFGFAWRQFKDAAPTTGLKFTKKQVPGGFYIFVFTSGPVSGTGESYMKLYPVGSDGVLGTEALGTTSYNPAGYTNGEEVVYRNLTDILTPGNGTDTVSFALGSLPSTVIANTYLSEKNNLNPSSSAVWEGLKWGDPSSFYTIYHFEIWNSLTIEQSKTQSGAVASRLAERGLFELP